MQSCNYIIKFNFKCISIMNYIISHIINMYIKLDIISNVVYKIINNPRIN